MLNCNYCDKKGLLIYPVRYAVASPCGAAGVPGLSGNFRIENGPQQIGEARYTLRALRAGYLYTYDERRGRFKAYVVMPTGHLWNFPLHYRAPHPSRIPFSCVEPGEIVRAYCLDIAHTPQDPATRIWIPNCDHAAHFDDDHSSPAGFVDLPRSGLAGSGGQCQCH